MLRDGERQCLESFRKFHCNELAELCTTRLQNSICESIPNSIKYNQFSTEFYTQFYSTAEKVLQLNYFGAKSETPRITENGQSSCCRRGDMALSR
jgi:hypothetical protein